MKVKMLWVMDESCETPWLAGAVDECLEDDVGLPPEYENALKEHPRARELVVCVPNWALRDLFKTPEVDVKVEKS
jgi:hypothetical protein